MKLVVIAMVGWLLLTTPSAAKAQEPQPQPRVVELKAPDGTFLKATYFTAGKPGPSVLLFHQANRTRTCASPNLYPSSKVFDLIVFLG